LHTRGAQPQPAVSTETQPAEDDTLRAASPEEVRSATLAGVRWGVMARVGIETAALLASVVLARLVSPAGFGRAATAIALVSLSAALVTGGFGTPIVQRRAITHAHLETTVLLSILAGALLSSVVYLLAPLCLNGLLGGDTVDLVRMASPAFLIVSAVVVPQALAQRRLNFRVTSLIEMGSTVFGVAVSVVLAALGLGARALVLGQLATPALAGMLYLTTTAPIRPRWHRNEARALLGFGVQTSASSLLGTAWMNLDYVVVNVQLGAAAAGYYWRAFQIGGVYQGKISQVMLRLALPVLSRTRDLDDVRRVRSRIVRVHATAIFPMLAIYILVAPEAVPLVFGARWEPTVLPSQILAGAGMVFALSTGMGALVLATGHPRAQLVNSLVSTVLYAGVVIAFAPLGITPLCVAVVVVNVVNYLGQYYFLVDRLIGIPFSDLWSDVAPALGGLIPCFALGACAAFGLTRAGASSSVKLAVVAAAGSVGYAVCLRTFFGDAWGDLRLLLTRALKRAPVDSRDPKASAQADGRSAADHHVGPTDGSAEPGDCELEREQIRAEQMAAARISVE
jgi:lipopolysaccharide exporter